jgi:dTDP-4-amino-4,6-dideoxygalactose transaminase
MGGASWRRDQGAQRKLVRRHRSGGSGLVGSVRLVSRLFLSPPDVGRAERALLLEAFDSNWIAPLGPHVDAFEQEFAASVGMPAAAALSSGTAALHLALILAGVGAGDDVLVPTLTFVATANAVAYVGARPVFIDSDVATWNMDPRLVEEELTERARTGRLPAAVLGVDLYGQCADWDPILGACAHFEVPVIEDAAEALGATYRGRAAGSFGVLGVFSFNGNKIMTTSGGGMLVGRDAAAMDRARFLGSQARDDAPHYEHSETGYNYRMSNLLAALGLAQLRGLPAKIARRRAINQRYRELLEGVPGIGFMPNDDRGEPTNWLTVVTVDAETFGASPAAIREHLETLDIEARPAWKPMHCQPLFDGAPVRGGAVAEAVFRRGLCLPSGSVMADADVDRVAAGVLETARRQ